jgi:hypothetical protein
MAVRAGRARSPSRSSTAWGAELKWDHLIFDDLSECGVHGPQIENVDRDCQIRFRECVPQPAKQIQVQWLFAFKSQVDVRILPSATDGARPENPDGRPCQAISRCQEQSAESPNPLPKDRSSASCQSGQELIAQIVRFGEECRNGSGHLFRGLGAVGVAGACPQVAIAVPGGPIPQQQPPLVGRPDQILKRHSIDLVGRGRRPLNEPPDEAMAKLIGVLEALDQAVTQLLIGGFTLMTRQPFAQTRDRVDQRDDIERGCGAGHVTASGCGGPFDRHIAAPSQQTLD